MPGFDNQVMWCTNMDFTDTQATHFDHLGNFTNGGDLAIGTGNTSPSQEIEIGHLTGSGGIVISYVSPNINIDGSGAGGSLVWQNISASQTLAVQNGYFCSGGTNLSLALPAVSVVGDIIEVVLIGSTSFTITQSAGQQIILGNRQTTAGVGGSLASTQQGDAIKIICQTTNLTWVAGAGSIGNFTIV